MLWPEGSASVVADLGSYLEPESPDEKICTFCLSKAGSYLVMASKSVLALFRLKPLTPLAIYPAFFPETQITQVISSPRGNFVAVLTADNRVAVFSVQPQKDIEEVLRIGYVVTPGPGEAIGARELWLEPLNTIQPEHKVVKLCSMGPLLVVYTEQHVHLVEWQSFKSRDPLKPPALRLLNIDFFDEHPEESINCASVGVWAKDEWISCLTTNSGKPLVLHFKGLSANSVTLVSTSLVPLQGVCSVDYNFRMGKLAFVTETSRVFVLSDPLSAESELFELSLDISLKINSVQWAPAGTVLLLSCANGWLLSSSLGLVLYHYQEKAATGVKPVGTVHGEWLVNADGLVLLDSNGELRIHNMLRWSGNYGSERTRPLLHGNGRLMVYHGPSPRGLQSNATGGSGSQMWLTVPLPTWYMAQNWPLSHVCSSPDGRYVAVSGTVGIMLFSLATRQWKEIGERDSMVHGGLCWHGRRLIAATQSSDDGISSLKMFSPVNTYHQKSLSGSSSNHWSTARNTQQNRESVSTPGSPSSGGTRSHIGHDPQGSSSAQGDLNNNSGSGSGLNHISALPSSTSVAALNLGSSSEQQVIAQEVLGSGPGSVVTLMSKGPHNLLAVLVGDTARLLIYDLAQNEFDIIRDIPLSGVLPGSRPAPAVRAVSLVDERRVLVLVGNTLVLISSIDENRKYQRLTIAEPIESFTYLAAEELLCVFDGQEMIITSWPPRSQQQSSQQQSSQAHPCSTNTDNDTDSETLGTSRSEQETSESHENGHIKEGGPEQERVGGENLPENASSQESANAYLTTIPLDAYPVHISPNRGVLALVEAEPIRSYDGSFIVARPVTSQEVYIPYVLEAALVSAFDKGVELARKYSKMPYFSGVLETLLYRAVTNDDEIDGVKLTLKLIAKFQEDGGARLIIAGCARKVDLKYWSRLFEAVGKSPAQIFDECLANGELETASEFLLVVQATEKQGLPDSDAANLAGLQLDGRTQSLYKAALAAGKLEICREICEFLLAVDGSGGALKHLRQLAATKY